MPEYRPVPPQINICVFVAFIYIVTSMMGYEVNLKIIKVKLPGANLNG